ncbi:MAG TPA: oxygen-independent coproporphyrinogen III oxidase [Ignavibacteriaceae bacterium]|nr:oxygen-independent coproporphyrinogen III oxidase [Ignavibacteriaceae bacterium]
MFEVDLEKVKKYDRPGPRYTSYPTAPHFNEEFKHDDLLDEIVKTNYGNNLPDLSLYFHLPYCDTLCYFCGCNMIITRNRDRVKEYLKYLKKEIDTVRTYILPDRKVTQLHWGGGTPTHLDPSEINELASYIKESFKIDDSSENSCEIDPRGLTREHLEALRKNGFNRISMGVQDFDEKVQKAVNRIQPEDITRQAIKWIRELGYHSINLDLMYGLPFQTLESFEYTLDKTIDISPDRIAVFNYAHVPWMKKHMALIHPEDLPHPEVKLQILKMTIEKLTQAGYVFIGMDHFAKPDDELAIALREKKLYRNFQGYSTNAGADLYAFGVTAISQLQNVYAQNYKTEKEYYKALDDEKIPVAKGYRLNEDDKLRRYVIMRLMCDFELNMKSVEEKFNINFREYFATGLNNLQEFIDDDLVEISGDMIKVKGIGMLLIRNIAMNFDGYIERKEDTAKYSRTV